MKPFRFLIITPFLLMSFFFNSCKKETKGIEYLKIKSTITYENYSGTFSNIWEVNDFLFAKVTGFNNNVILKLDLEGNILDSITYVYLSAFGHFEYFNNENRIQFYVNPNNSLYSIFDINNAQIKTITIDLNNSFDRIKSTQTAKSGDHFIAVNFINNISLPYIEFQFLKINSLGTLINNKLVKFATRDIYSIEKVVASSDRIYVISLLANGALSGYNIIQLNNNLDTLWNKNFLIKNGSEFLNATIGKGGELNLYYNPYGLVNQFQIMISEDGQTFIENKFEGPKNYEKIAFIENSNDVIGQVTFSSPDKSDALIKYSKSGEYVKTLVKNSKIHQPNYYDNLFGKLIEKGNFYYMIGGSNRDNPKPTLTIIEK